MILPAGRFQVFVATRPVDFRKGMDSLAAVVRKRLRLDPSAVPFSCSAPSASTG